MDNIPEPGLIFWLINCCSGGTGPRSSMEVSGPRTTSAPSNKPESPPLAYKTELRCGRKGKSKGIGFDNLTCHLKQITKFKFSFEESWPMYRRAFTIFVQLYR